MEWVRARTDRLAQNWSHAVGKPVEAAIGGGLNTGNRNSPGFKSGASVGVNDLLMALPQGVADGQSYVALPLGNCAGSVEPDGRSKNRLDEMHVPSITIRASGQNFSPVDLPRMLVRGTWTISSSRIG